MTRERIFITVKTYPNLTRKSGELVCTAGITENGEWRRIYPLEFRSLGEQEQFKKFQWISVETEPATPKDDRPESRRLDNRFPIEPQEEIKQYNLRSDILFTHTHVYTSKRELLKDMREKKTSLAIFKPTEVLSMNYHETEKEWKEEAIRAYIAKAEQYTIFAEQDRRRFKEAVEKIPYKFNYVFKDSDNVRMELMVEDWEIGMCYRNSYKHGRSPDEAAQLVKKKYEGFITERDLYFFLGTSLEWQRKNAPNPFMIVGVYYPLIQNTEQSTIKFDDIT